MKSNDHVAWLKINDKPVLIGNTGNNGGSNHVCFPICIPIRKNDTISFDYSGTDMWGAFLYIYGTI